MKKRSLLEISDHERERDRDRWDSLQRKYGYLGDHCGSVVAYSEHSITRWSMKEVHAREGENPFHDFRAARRGISTYLRAPVA